MIPVFRLGIPVLIESVWLSGRCTLGQRAAHIVTYAHTHTHTAELQLKKVGAETAVAVIVLDKVIFTNVGRQTGQREMRKTNIQGLKEYSGFKNLA